jgi:PAS domain S-box-containing protein
VGSNADILDLVHESVVTRDAAGRILSWNKASEALYGIPRAGALGREIHALLHTRHEALDSIEAELAASGNWEGELTRTTPMGAVLVLDVRWTIERDAHGNLVRIVETARDISRRRAAEEALRTSEYRYRNMFQAMAVGFSEIDFTAVGMMLIPLRDQGITDLRGHLMANRDFVRETMRRAVVIDSNPGMLTLLGAERPDQVIGKPIDHSWPAESEPVYIDALVASMTRQPHLVTETRLARVDGGEIDVLFNISLSQENRKRGVMLIGIVDITARKAAEAALARVQAEFAHAARVSMLGELTASIAHEVNQPLAAIATSGSASLRWLANDRPDLGEVRELSERIVADARRAADIIARVRAMAERREPERAMLSLNALVAEAVAFLRHELHAQSVDPVLALDPALPLVSGDRTQLQQVLVNLIVNALQAMAGQPQRRLALTTTLRDGRVTLTVEDNGPGIAEPARLFDSFYTTKPTGMGMGLPICRGIAEAHGGGIAAENGAVGARFTLTLPADPDHTNVLPA